MKNTEKSPYSCPETSSVRAPTVKQTVIAHMAPKDSKFLIESGDRVSETIEAQPSYIRPRRLWVGYMYLHYRWPEFELRTSKVMIEAELESLFDLREPRSISRTSVKLSTLGCIRRNFGTDEISAFYELVWEMIGITAVTVWTSIMMFNYIPPPNWNKQAKITRDQDRDLVT